MHVSARAGIVGREIISFQMTVCFFTDRQRDIFHAIVLIHCPFLTLSRGCQRHTRCRKLLVKPLATSKSLGELWWRDHNLGRVTPFLLEVSLSPSVPTFVFVFSGDALGLGFRPRLKGVGARESALRIFHLRDIPPGRRLMGGLFKLHDVAG